MFKEKLKINDNIILDRIHRLNPLNSNPPIVVRFAFFKDKESEEKFERHKYLYWRGFDKASKRHTKEAFPTIQKGEKRKQKMQNSL